MATATVQVIASIVLVSTTGSQSAYRRDENVWAWGVIALLLVGLIWGTLWALRRPSRAAGVGILVGTLLAGGVDLGILLALILGMSD